MKEKEKIEKILLSIKSKNDGTTLDFAVPMFASKRLTTYQSMRSDLILCKNCITELSSETISESIKLSLFYTIVAIYGKCFTDATHTKSPKLELSVFNTKKELIPFHEDIMDMRHNLVAHRGSTEHDLSVAYLSLGVSDYSKRARIKQMKRKSFDTSKIKNYKELFDFLIVDIDTKLEKEGAKLWNFMLNNFTPNQIAKFKIAGPTERI